jgi:signal recognition particle subunit SRP54
MFETLTRGFKDARLRLSGQAEVTEANIEDALRDVRTALLDADVDYGVAKAFVEKVKGQVLGGVIKTKARKGHAGLDLTPGDHFIKICHDELEALMAPPVGAHGEGAELKWKKGRGDPTVFMLVGLQGSGKTTTAGKLARWILREEHRRPLLIACDVYRPAAVDQLKSLGAKLNVPVYSEPGSTDPVAIAVNGLKFAKNQNRNVVIIDTAGRLAIDDELMTEMAAIAAAAKPDNTLLVIDAMIGQDAVRTAAEFHQRVPLSGFIMTKLDGDARGGSALSIRQVTGVPIRFVGSGETLDRLEAFRPEGFASRILGFGDIVGLVQDFEQAVDAETAAKAEKDAERLLSGQFNLEDFLEQLALLKKMGSLKELMEKLPFFGQLPEGFEVDEREFKRFEAMIHSMTPFERRHPEKLNDSRLARIAKGSGRREYEVRDLLQRFKMMRQMMGALGQQGPGFLAKLPGFSDLAKLSQLGGAGFGGLNFADLFGNSDAMKAMNPYAGVGAPAGGPPRGFNPFAPGAGMPPMPPGFGGFPPGVNPYGANPFGAPGMGGMGGFGAKSGPSKPKADDKTKAKRKAQKEARKKNRKK